jgi:hypothetical protein
MKLAFDALEREFHMRLRVAAAGHHAPRLADA